MIITNINELIQNLENQLYNPYYRTLGIRIVFVDNFVSLKIIEKELLKSKYKLEYLENYLPSGKNWLSIRDLNSIIEKLLENQRFTFLFSLDNLLRFYNNEEINLFTNNILRLRTKTDKGILIILLAGLKERIKILQEKALFYEFRSTTNNQVKFFILNPNIDIKIDCLLNLKDILGCWRLESEEIYIKHKVIYERSCQTYPDTAIYPIKIENYKDMIKELGFNDEIYFSDQQFEKELIHYILKNKIYSFSDMFPQIKNFLEFSEKFLDTDDNFSKKCILNFAYNYLPDYRHILNENKISFLKKAYKELADKEIIKKLLFNALKFDPSIEHLLCEEMKENIAFQKITGLLKCEKEFLLNLFKDEKISIDDLKYYSEEFFYYLDTPSPMNIKPEQEWFLNYINLYKKSKLRDKIEKNLEEFISNKIKNFYDWYYSFDWVIKLAEELKNEVEIVIWIDAVGFEWSGFIINYLKSKNIPIHKFYIARAELPTITELNRPFFEVSEIREFDKLIHERYEFPSTIIKQMEKLKEILDKTIYKEKKTLIFSDHGTSALVRLKDPLRLPEKIEFEYGGRFYKGEIFYESNFILKHKKNGNIYSIALGHNSVNTKPFGESHGGATPEELVTFLIIAGGYGELQYQVEVLTKEISKRKGKLEIIIKPTPEDLLVKFYIDQEPKTYNRTEWKFIIDVSNLKPGKHTIEVYIGSYKFKEDFKIVGGFEEEELL